MCGHVVMDIVDVYVELFMMCSITFLSPYWAMKSRGGLHASTIPMMYQQQQMSSVI
jgi:hypothetical protein